MHRESNWEADDLTQIVSVINMGEELTHKLIMIEKNNHPSIFERGIDLDIFKNDINIAGDWRTEFREYLENSNKEVPCHTPNPRLGRRRGCETVLKRHLLLSTDQINPLFLATDTYF